MEGADGYNESLFSTARLEEFVPQTQARRQIRAWLNEALSKMDANFSALYEPGVKGGLPSIAPAMKLGHRHAQRSGYLPPVDGSR